MGTHFNFMINSRRPSIGAVALMAMLNVVLLYIAPWGCSPAQKMSLTCVNDAEIYRFDFFSTESISLLQNRYLYLRIEFFTTEPVSLSQNPFLYRAVIAAVGATLCGYELCCLELGHRLFGPDGPNFQRDAKLAALSRKT